METERIQIAVRVLDAFYACVPPRMEDVIALREMAESPREERMWLTELACTIIDRERAKYEAAGLTLPRFGAINISSRPAVRNSEDQTEPR